MNTKFFASSLIALASVASSAAFADQYYGSNQPTVVASQNSRAEVQAAYFQAVKEGTLPVVAEAGDITVKTTAPVMSRAEVKNQAVQWTHAQGKVSSELM